MRSLSARLLTAVSVLLALFFGITILLLDAAFRRSAETAIADRLEVQLIVLLAAAEPLPGGGLGIDEALPEARFETPGSGLYGQIDRAGAGVTGGASETVDRALWRSPSAIGSGLAAVPALGPGERRFTRTQTLAGEPVFALSLGVAFELAGDGFGEYVFTAAEHLAPFEREVAGFRKALFGWFALLTVLLLASQALLLRWLLRPLRRVEREIAAVERGEATALGTDYPRELQGVTANLNALVGAERERLARYRDTLGNLAHSLKTPLAVMRNAVDGGDGRPELLRQQLDHMQQMVAYQLQRAATWGATTLGHRPVAVAPIVNRLAASLAKVYADKRVVCRVDACDAQAVFFGEEGDLMEVLGNLMDNAFKWCDGRVEVVVRQVPAPGRRRPGLVVEVADDGSGIDAQAAERMTERGVRGDERIDGHGIGLSIVRDIVSLYGGELDIGRAALGGARVGVHFHAS